MAEVSASQHFTRSNPCPICGSHSDAAPGTGQRCAGFRSNDGQWAYCQRTDMAGDLPANSKTSPPTYAHRLTGPCNCGKRHDQRTWLAPGTE